MARIKIEIPNTHPIFKTTLNITIDQINYGGHVGNDRYLAMMHESRLRWFQSLGYKDELSISDGIGIFVVDAACEFTGEIFHGDKVSILMYISDQHKYGFDLVYKFEIKDEKVVFKGKTGIMSVDLDRKKAISFPSEFFERLIM